MGQFWYIFLWLIIAHILADFPLQTNRVFAARYKYKFGGIIHVSIHYIVGLILLFPYLASWEFWLSFTAVTIIHYFIDTIKKGNIWAFVLDQVSHLIVLAGVAFLCRGVVSLNIPDWLSIYYLNTNLLVYLIGYLTAAYIGTIVVLFLKSDKYRKKPPTGYEKITGVLARVATLTCVILAFKLHWGFAVLIPIPETIRFLIVYSKRKLPHLPYRNITPRDVVVSFIYTLIVAIPLSVFFAIPFLPNITL